MRFDSVAWSRLSKTFYIDSDPNFAPGPGRVDMTVAIDSANTALAGRGRRVEPEAWRAVRG